MFGTFAGLAEGAVLEIGSQAFTITYAGGTGNDVILTAAIAPPPPPPPPPLWGATIIGTPGADLISNTNTIYGQQPASIGADTIYGLGGNDELSGIAGDDDIYGGSGKDKLRGGDGNDSVHGGSGGDKLYGDAGDDLLDGGKGENKLVGGDGADSFRFSSELEKKRVHKIVDFTHGEDRILLDHDIFTKLVPDGLLGEDHFTIGKHAKGTVAHIVYDRKVGTLTYDKNGSKSGADTTFAKLARSSISIIRISLSAELGRTFFAVA